LSNPVERLQKAYYLVCSVVSAHIFDVVWPSEPHFIKMINLAVPCLVLLHISEIISSPQSYVLPILIIMVTLFLFRNSVSSIKVYRKLFWNLADQDHNWLMWTVHLMLVICSQGRTYAL
jgi:hypothetical protein